MEQHEKELTAIKQKREEGKAMAYKAWTPAGVDKTSLSQGLAMQKEADEMEKKINAKLHEKIMVPEGDRWEVSVQSSSMVDPDPSSAADVRRLRTTLENHERTTNEALAFMKGITRHPVIRIVEDGSRGPSKFSSTFMGADFRAQSRSGIGIEMGSGDPVSTYVHEMGHQFEDHARLAMAARDFRDYRTAKAGTSDTNLKSRFPGYDFGVDEIGNEDSFQEAFALSGNPADKYYAGKNYRHGSTEILSMGVELLYKHPGHFAKADPEYFKFIVGVLHGHIQ